MLPALKSGGRSRELAVALTRIALKTVAPVESLICATEINALASLMYGPFWQLPEAVASLNFTLMVLPVGVGAWFGSVVLVRGD